MNTFRQHKPGFIDLEPEPPFEFDSTQELLGTPMFKQTTELSGFSHFGCESYQRPDGTQEFMIRAFFINEEHYVMGYTSQEVAFHLFPCFPRGTG